MAKPQLKSRAWNLIVVIGSLVLIALGFGGLFLLQSGRAGAAATNWFVIGIGIITFLCFAGPGIAFVARKRIAWVKKHIPGGSLAWVRAHLYLPILALVAAWVHASTVPFRDVLSSGKVLLAIAVIVSVCGVARHHLIGVTKAAINADAQISKIAVGRSRAFRQLVIDYKQLRRPLADIEADAAALRDEDKAAWAQVVDTQRKIDDDFPRGGGQSPAVRAYKLLRAVHAPLTIVLFLTLSFHVVDVLAVTDSVLADDNERIASVANCVDCHTDIGDEYATSSMAHAQTGTIMEAQLPVTLAKNEELARELGDDQEDLFEDSAKVCINCHSPIGAERVEDDTAVYPFDEPTEDDDAAISGGGDAVLKDGISCTTCHTQSRPTGELSGAFPMGIDGGTRDDYGTVYGPLFDDPDPLPVRVHDIGEGEDGFWDDPIATSIACGACHNVKLDIDGDGLAPDTDDDDDDDDSDFQLNENELDIEDGDGDGDAELQDLVLQTTFDEWQDYVAAFDDQIRPRNDDVRNPLGCIDCHMPSNPGQAEEPIVDQGPGFLPVPDRPHRSHSFIGVDYDLDPAQYTAHGLSEDAVNDVIAERKALLGSAVSLEVAEPVEADVGIVEADVIVTNNLLGHTFPTGFAFARQFWLEVSAVDSDGDDVCLVDLFAAAGVDSPCSSGTIDDPDDILPQCESPDVAALGLDQGFEAANDDIVFAEPARIEDCDPWLANFQKILTDGDPFGSGAFTEVAYQSFLPDIVKVRERVFDGASMNALQSVRQVVDPETGELVDGDSITLPYFFDTADLPAGEEITVTATLHFRHLPPEFVRSLAEEQEGLDNLTESARIDDPDELTKNLTVTDVVTVESGEGAVVACEGPQNDPDATILDCLEPVDGDEAVDLASGAGIAAAGVVGTGTPLSGIVSGMAVGVVSLIGGALGRRRRSILPA